uniref:Galectin n=1 Tax=Panagrellus redivivus TaxID=6233 RepID=A0A7E4UZ91_PANRE
MILTIENDCVPFTAQIPTGICVGECFHIFGRVNLANLPDSEKTFAIELLSYPNVVFHIRFRFHDLDENYVAINACDFSGFDQSTEKRVNYILLSEHFHLEIHVKESFYTVLVNGDEIVTYNHVFPYQSIKAIGVYGAVNINTIELDDIRQHVTIEG